jgi:hypothetical protein
LSVLSIGIDSLGLTMVKSSSCDRVSGNARKGVGVVGLCERRWEIADPDVMVGVTAGLALTGLPVIFRAFTAVPPSGLQPSVSR